MIGLKEIKEYIDNSVLDDMFNERECELYQEKDEKIVKLKDKYKVDYENLLTAIKNLPPHFFNTREEILKRLDDYLIKENMIMAYENEKFYKVGICDGIKIMLESIKNNNK